MALTFDRTLDNGIILTDAYAQIRELSVDFRNGIGSIALDVHPTENDTDKPPVEQIRIQFGQKFAEGGEFPTLAVALADPVVAAAYAQLREALYYMIATTHPLFRFEGGR